MTPAVSHRPDDLRTLVAAASAGATPEALGMLLLREDPQFARISARRAPALVDAALEDGRRLAETSRLAWGAAPGAIAESNAVRVIKVGEAHDYGTTVLYAEYTERPPQIRLFLPAIDALNRCLGEATLQRVLGLSDATPVFLAHELYHHFDSMRASGRLAARHRVPLLRLGPVRWSSGLASLAEIAAGAFAQHLLGLRYHPKILDMITLFHVDPRAARRMAYSLRGVGQRASASEPEESAA